MRKHAIAIVGFGAACEPHAKSLLDLSDRAEVVLAVSRSEARTQAFAARFKIPVTPEIDKANHRACG